MCIILCAVLLLNFLCEVRQGVCHGLWLLFFIAGQRPTARAPTCPLSLSTNSLLHHQQLSNHFKKVVFTL